MTRNELVAQALAEYETAQGRPCSNAVIIARMLNKRGTSATTEVTQEPKDAELLADEVEVFQYVMDNDPTSAAAGIIVPGASRRIRRGKRGAPDAAKVKGTATAETWRDVTRQHGGDETVFYRPDFGQDYHLRSTTTTTETPSRAEQELGAFIDGREVAEAMRELAQ